MLQLKVLVIELGPVDGLSSRAVAFCEVSTLDHERLDDSVESRTLVAEAFLAGSKGSEVFGSLTFSQLAKKEMYCVRKQRLERRCCG